MRPDGFEGRSALGTWLYHVATNAALIKRRRKRAEVEVSLEDYLPTFKTDGHREGDRSLLLVHHAHFDMPAWPADSHRSPLAANESGRGRVASKPQDRGSVTILEGATT